MSFALSAIMIALFLLPGAAVLKAYYTSIKEKKSSIHVTASELLLRGLVFSFLIHFLAIFILTLFGVFVDFKLFYTLLAGKELLLTNKRLSASFLQFSLYTFLLLLFCFYVTKRVKSYIQDRNLDLNYYSLRNTNYWFQIFSARYLEMHNIQGERDKTDILFLDVLSNKEVIYSGFLLDFNYSPQKDELENIILTNTSKRAFQKVPDEQGFIKSSTPSFISGDVFVIQANEILNINIYYVSLPGMASITDQDQVEH